jgi:hypothetical protein
MTSIKNNLGLIGVCAAIFFTALLIIWFTPDRAFGHTTIEQPSQVGKFETYQFFATSTSQLSVGGSPFYATTSTATSTNIYPYFDSSGTYDPGFMVIAGAKRVTFYFSRGDRIGTGNSGSTNYRVQVSPTCSPIEADWMYFNKLVQNIATSTDTFELNNVTVAAGTSTTIASMDLRFDTFCAARVTAVETTDGDHSVKASADF